MDGGAWTFPFSNALKYYLTLKGPFISTSKYLIHCLYFIFTHKKLSNIKSTKIYFTFLLYWNIHSISLSFLTNFKCTTWWAVSVFTSLWNYCVRVCVCACMRAQLLSGVWLCNSMDCSLPGSSVYGISQARILERVAISYSGESFWCGDWILISYISCISKEILYNCVTWEHPQHHHSK